MNRLIIIGNGFDLAHGLPTSYQDFIEQYWANVEHDHYEDALINFVRETSNKRNLNGNSFRAIKNQLYHGVQLKFKNSFFAKINAFHNIRGWVDIEMIYYQNLKSFAKAETSPENKLLNIKNLNREVEEISILFEKYLYENINPIIASDPQLNNIFRMLNETKFSYENAQSDYRREFSSRNLEYVDKHLSKGFMGEKFDSSFALNFNYTSTFCLYNLINCEIIHIHGLIGDKLNPIVLGFGDETDKFYSELEDLNENEFLMNIKSFYYLNSTEYKQTFDYLESGPFQVHILGHSCGLSDRTLLESIFNHPMCKSIKVFYFKNKNGEDNYNDILHNISRHFPNKKRMREIIVNKKFCTPLPQFWYDDEMLGIKNKNTNSTTNSNTKSF